MASIYVNDKENDVSNELLCKNLFNKPIDNISFLSETLILMLEENTDNGQNSGRHESPSMQ